MGDLEKTTYVAHTRSADSQIQTLETHLTEVGEIAARLASKIDADNAGRLIGLLHDFGKSTLPLFNGVHSIGYYADFFRCSASQRSSNCIGLM